MGCSEKTTNLVQNLHDLLINGSDKTFRNMVKHHVTASCIIRKTINMYIGLLLSSISAGKPMFFCNLCLTGATSTLKFPIAQIATNLPCESERLQQVGLDRLVYGLRFFFTIKRLWILHFGGVLSHGLPPNHPCSFRIVHYKLSMGSPIFTVKARGKHPRNRTFNGLRMAISRCPDFKT